MTPDEAAERLRRAGYRVKPGKKGPLPQPLAIPGMSEAVQHRHCCDECDAARRFALAHGWAP